MNLLSVSVRRARGDKGSAEVGEFPVLLLRHADLGHGSCLLMDRSRAVLALLLWSFVAVRADDGGEGAGDDDKQLSPLFFLTLEPGKLRSSVTQLKHTLAGI